MAKALETNADIFLLAAGFGTRLRPLTDNKPKALVEVGGKPLINWHLERISQEGFSRVIINVHYLAEQIISHIGDGSNWGLEIVISEEDPILDTGGGIKKIEKFLQHQNLITINSDVFIGNDFSLNSLLSAHLQKEDPVATLLLREDPESEAYGEIGLDKQNKVVSFLGAKISEPAELFMYTGIQVLSRKVFTYMKEKKDIFSITRDIHIQMLQSGESMYGVNYSGYWNDCGTLERLNQVKEYLENRVFLN